MKEKLTDVRIRILFSILHMENHRSNAAAIAKSLHISKSTVSRALEAFESEGIIQKDRLRFTPEGRRVVAQYWSKKEILKPWLLDKGNFTEITAENEAITMLLHLNEDAIDLIIETIRPNRSNCVFAEMDGFCERCIDYLLDDGIYTISFTIYKSVINKNMKVSMANEGFYHPGQLIVKDGVGTVCLTSKKVLRPLPLGNGMMAGKVDKVSYLQNHKFETAIHDGNQWKFPTTSMKFTYNKGEGILFGTATLKLGCSAGKIYMPESIAVFSMAITL